MKKKLAIHSENILPIIKKWLYSDKDIFLRELVSNATDAINKLKIIQGKASEEWKISISIDKEKKTLTIADTGVGMTDEEVEKYIAQIAFSGAEEFVEKYKESAESDQIIGHFGLGFYSAYMVSTKVEIDTLSYLEGAKPVFWSCDGSSDYVLDKGKREVTGTEITLYIEDEEYLDEAKIRDLLTKYCSFMPYPIELNGKAIDNKDPLWLKNPADCTDKEYLDFYRKLFPLEPEPIFWIHLNVDYPFNLKGILYFPKIHRRFDMNESTIRLYCNRVFVSDNCKDVLPDYLMMLRGAIDSPDIPLNVSRSYLQVDKNVKQLSAHISKKVSDRLTSLYKTNRDKFLESWPDIEMIVKLGVLQDPKFYDRVKDALVWKTSLGEWSTVADYLERNPNNKVYYAIEERASNILNLYKEKKLEILFTNAAIDTALIQHLEDKLAPAKFQRIDGALDESLLDPSREKSLLDADGKSQSAKIASFIQSAIDQKELEVEAKSLASDALPGVVVLDEGARRFRDYLTLTQGKSMPHAGKKTFVVNTNHKLIQSIERLQAKQPEIAKEMARQVYDLSLLSQKELEPTQVEELADRQTLVLEKLASLIS